MCRTRPVLGAGALGVLCAVAVACDRGEPGPPAQPPPRAVEVLTMAQADVRDVGEYLGSLLSRGSVNVLPQVAGYVRRIHIRPGQRVAAGDVLIEIDAREENAALSSASAQAASARTALDLARRSLTRANQLHRDGVVSGQEIDQRRADVAAAEAAVTAAGAEVSQRRMAVSYNVIRATGQGVVGDVRVRLGDYVTATTPVTTVARANALELSVSIPAVRARALAPGAPLEILAENGSVLVTTDVFYVAPEADPRTQLVEIKATFDNTVGLRPQEVVRARVVFAVTKELQIPLTAVQRQSGQAFAFVVVDRAGQLVVERRPIQLGALRERGYIVEGGLVAGDRIAVSSLQALRDGAAVTIKQPRAEAPRAR